ncbi:MAG: efflux RND transporter permease subunit, partial [Gammaproteobacteria bacterium]|nr:efflux RND transporter permease subunit [Gammaproteobacteria bacterium]
LVALTLWLFFGLRFAFWVAMGLPASFLGGFFLMEMMGQSFNMLSLVALLVALGLLMDDAIVLSENIAAHRSRGKKPLQAAIDGTTQVLPGVLSSFLTTLTIFVPLAFLEGQIGAVLKVIPVVLIAVLVISLIEAFLILPAHLYHALDKEEEGRSAIRTFFEKRLDQVREQWVGGLVDRAVEWRYLTLGLMVAIFLISLGLATSGALKFQGFPSVDGDQIDARILLPQGSSLQQTEAVVAALQHSLQAVNDEFRPRQPQQQDLIRNVVVRYGVNADAGEMGPHLATVSVDLLPAEDREGTVASIIQRWRAFTEIPPGVITVAFKEPALGPGGKAIEIRLRGATLTEMKGASLELQQWLSAYHGVSDLYDDLRPGKPELQITLRDEALALGLDAATIAQQLRAGFFGTTAAEIQVGIEAYEVDVRLAAEDRDEVSDLEQFIIHTAAGSDVPLLSVATISEEKGYARIRHLDGQRTVTVSGNVDSDQGNASEILADTRSRFLPQLQQHYPSLRIEYGGGSEEDQKTAASMVRALVIGLVGIFVVLSFQFRNYREPILVMVIIPMALIGVFWGHYLMGLSLSMPSMLGLISLAGIAVNDSILLVTFIKEHRSQGMAVAEAAKEAARARFRAILLTSATTIVGLLPILSETSLQAQVLIPLVVSIAFGLLATTLMVLFIIPVLYVIFDDLGWSDAVTETASPTVTGS